VKVRRSLLLLVVLAVAAMVPASAFAQAPANDTKGGAIAIAPPWSSSLGVLPAIPPTGPAGGWTDATGTEDVNDEAPSCLGSAGFHSMWYTVNVLEASVLTIVLKSSAVDRYQPVVTIINTADNHELACGLGGSDSRTDPAALATSYVPKGLYWVRVASVQNSTTGSNIELPTIQLFGSLHDVTPPVIQVAVSGKTKILGPGKLYTFDANGSVDNGSGLNPKSAVWTFYDNGTPTQLLGDHMTSPLTTTHAWKTPGLHKVTLRLADQSGNTNTYAFNVLVHNFVPPKVSLLITPPAPGSRTLRLTLVHDVPIRVRLVVMQGGKVLRAIPSKLVKGTRAKTRLVIALTRKVGTSSVVISGVASDLGQFPNTVPLLTCSVDPVHGGGKCA
jgi:PKD domain